jgi:dihydrofolate synthase/folylpolyglutamate synthase
MEIEPEYQAALDYLYTFVDYSLTKSVRYSPDQFDLGRMRDFVAQLGQPHQAYPIIHVAGTKGKGSVAAMCASVLQAAGYRVGFYTSPHLVDYAERIQIDRQPIPHGDLVDLVDELKPLLDAGTRLTTFEITTALAFLYFAHQKVQVAVIEVGLGGRLDATNVITPAVSVITSLSYDHTQYLGETLAQIAAEKAGIIKPGVPVVLAPQKEEARLVIERVAAERGSPLTMIGRDYLYAEVAHSLLGGQTMLVWSAADQEHVNDYIESGGLLEWEPTRLNIPLLGYHQLENAATAYGALQVFRQAALPLSDAAIRQGFSQTSWPGRFEIVQRYPPVVLDCAHNRDSALKLRLALDDYFPGIPVVMIFGASEDKDIPGMFAELLPRVRQVIATRSIHPRAIEPEKLVELAHRFGRPARAIDTIEEAIDEGLRVAGDEALLLVTGSIFIAAAARDTWYNHLKRKGNSENEEP